MKLKQKEHAQKAHATKHIQIEEDSLSLWANHLAKSFLISIGAAIILLLSLSLGAYFYPDPDRLILPFSYIAAAGTALIGGFATARLHKHSALLCGLLSGALCSVVMMLLSLCFRAAAVGYSAWLSCLLHTAFFVFSIIGAYLGLPKPQKKAKHRKHA